MRFGGAAVWALAGLSAYFFVAGRDIAPPDVSDVLPPPVLPIADAENMIPVLLDATNRLALSAAERLFVSGYRRDGWNRQIQTVNTNLVLTAQEAEAWADRILAAHAAFFAALDEAAQRPRAQYPSAWSTCCNQFWYGSSDPEFSQLWEFENTAFLYGGIVALRARRLRECGQAEAAEQDLLRLGEMFARLSYRLENGTVMLHVRSPLLLAWDELVRTAIDETLPDRLTAEIDAALVRWRNASREAFRREWRRGVLRARNVLPKLAEGNGGMIIPKACFEWPDSWAAPSGLKTLVNALGRVVLAFPGYRKYLFQPNRSVLELADIVREIEPLADSFPATAATWEPVRAFQAAHPAEIRWMRRNACGTSAVNGYFGWNACYRSLGRATFGTDACRVAIAVARYKRRNGCLPSTLGALVPDFLSEVPRDPFDANRSLGYNVEQGTLHTVGAEGRFDGKVRNPQSRYGGLRIPEVRYLFRLDGRSMEIPLKE